MRDAYPRDLAAFVKKAWGPSRSLPALEHLEALLSISYHTSLLREEARPIQFRLLVCSPDILPPADGPPRGLHRLVFVKPRRLNRNELRRLSPAADYYRSLVGVHLNQERKWIIWGLAHSGLLWADALNGGARVPPDLPQVPVVHVVGPSHMTVCRGSRELATLQGGRLTTPLMQVLQSDWLTRLFAEFRAELVEQHQARRENDDPDKQWPPIDESFPRMLVASFMNRLINAMRLTSSGSTVIFVPNDRAEQFSGDNAYIDFKYRFTPHATRRRFSVITEAILRHLAEAFKGTQEALGWSHYVNSVENCQLHQLDEAFTELAYLIAGLTAIDGAVILSRSFEILGFGAEITELSDVKRVARALDAEGDNVSVELTESQGMRHRSVYRLCNAVTSIMGLIISHDGELRFVKHREGRVIYWNQLAQPALDSE